MIKSILPYIVIFLIGAVAGTWLCRNSHFQDDPVPIEEVTDTLYVRDTITIDRPVPSDRMARDTMYLPVHDTTRIHDTLYVSLPYEVKTYKGDDYYAEVSGYNPSLYYLEVYPKREVVTRTEKVPRKHHLYLGLEGGYSVVPHIPLYLEYDYSLHKNVAAYGRLFYDFPRRSYGLSVGIKLQAGW